MEKLASLWNLFRVGESVSDPVAWKKHQITATILAGVFVAALRVLRAFGLDLPVSDEDAAALAAGVLVVVNVLLTLVTSDKVGVLPARPASGDPGDARPSGG